MSKDALRAAATGSAAEPPKTIFQYLDDARVKQGIAAVAGKYLTAERMLRLCVMAVKKTPKLAACDPTTVLGAMMTSAALGLEPNTVQQQAFLIPYKTRRKNPSTGQWVDVLECQFQIGYRGFVTLAYRTPRLKGLMAEAIHKGDHFKHRLGSGTFLEFEKALVDRGEMIGAFSYAQLDGGQEVACVLPLDEVLKIRSRSETYRTLVRAVEAAQNESERQKAETKLAETPWVLWEDDMAAKSAIKKHAKLLPIASNDALAVAAEVDNRAEGGGLDLRAMTTVEQVREVFEEGGEPPALPDGTAEQEASREAFGTVARGNQQATATPAPAPAEPERNQAAASGGGKRKPPAAAAPAAAAPAEPQRTYAEIADAIKAAKDLDSALLELDGARHLPPDQAKDLKAMVDRMFSGD